MGAIYDFYSSTKVPTANGTLSFTSSEIPSDGVTDYFLAWSDTNEGTTLSDITRVRVKASGVTIFDVGIAPLLAYNQRFSRSRAAYADRNLNALSSSAGLGNATQRLTIPLRNLYALTMDEQDQCQFPPGAQVTIEIAFGGTLGTSPVMQVGWRQTDMPARMYPKMIGSQMSILASQANARYAFSEEGIICAYGLNTVGIAKKRLVLSGEQVVHMGGALRATPSTTNVEGLHLEMQQLESRLGDLANTTAVTNALGATIVDPTWWEVHKKLPAVAGRTFIELQTLSTWVGGANEFNYHAIVPLVAAS